MNKQHPIHPPIELLHQRIRAHLSDMTGREDLQGLEISWLIRRLANAYESCHERHMADCDLSGPRLGLLMRLELEERRGNQNGVRPTELSLNQRVSRNTISALLSGLEERGLVERRLDPEDRRAFRIRLTDRGRQIVSEHAPRLIDNHNRLAAALTTAEKNQLIDLLVRLYANMTADQSSAPSAETAVE